VSKESTTKLAIEVGHDEPYQLHITREDVVIRGLPRSLHGAKFAQVSDIHAGFAGLEKVYEEALAAVNASEPDFIFFTGDYIDKKTTNPNYPMVEYLRRFRARRGVYACLGNHDHRRGKVLTGKILERAGVQLLYNESVRLESGLWLAGVDDLYEGEPDIARTFADLPADRTSIVLSHNPRLIEKAKGRDIVILSGHTHGAQFRLKFPPPVMICYLHLRCWQVSGWYRRGNTRLYVNRGLGVTGKPYRIDCPAEIAIFRMAPDPADDRVDAGETSEHHAGIATAGRS
jgi:predicted MPP superfamily phosphohydrolase